jgi:hypothetical protein
LPGRAWKRRVGEVASGQLQGRIPSSAAASGDFSLLVH